MVVEVIGCVEGCVRGICMQNREISSSFQSGRFG